MTRASEQLNYPGAKLYSHLRNEDERVLYKDVAEYVERQPHRQVFAQPRNVRHPRAKGPRMKRPPNMTQGRVPAIDLNDRWTADLADLTAQPSIPAEGVNRGGGVPYQYILVVLNVFSKELYARPLQYKSPEAVVAAFREIEIVAHGIRRSLRGFPRNESHLARRERHARREHVGAGRPGHRNAKAGDLQARRGGG